MTELVPIPPRRSGRMAVYIVAAILVLAGATAGIAFAVDDDDSATPTTSRTDDPSRISERQNGGLLDQAPDLTTANARGDLNIIVVAQQWSWTFNYTKGGSRIDEPVWDSRTPDENPTLWLVKDKSVTFDLYSPDVIHSFWPTDLLFKMDVVPGRAGKNYFTVTPTKLGSFEGRCAELCGTGHSRMVFNVEVVDQQAFDAHLEQLRAGGQTGIKAPGGYATEISGTEQP